MFEKYLEKVVEDWIENVWEILGKSGIVTLTENEWGTSW